LRGRVMGKKKLIAMIPTEGLDKDEMIKKATRLLIDSRLLLKKKKKIAISSYQKMKKLSINTFNHLNSQ
jgi:hypothetical protein